MNTIRLNTRIARQGQGFVPLGGYFRGGLIQPVLASGLDDYRAPARARVAAVAHPIPELTPVTMAVLPVKNLSSSIVVFSHFHYIRNLVGMNINFFTAGSVVFLVRPGNCLKSGPGIMGRRVSPPEAIYTPGPSSGKDQIKEDKAENSGQVPSIPQGPEPLRRVDHEVGHGHFS